MSKQSPILLIDGSPLTPQAVCEVARFGRQVQLTDTALQNLAEGRRIVDEIVAQEQVTYGVNTGFGSLSRVTIPPDDVRQVQRNLIRSHSAGVGEPLPSEVVRAMMVILLASLTRGHSGVRPSVAQTLAAVLNADIVPVVPSRGSVGASGDLAPLSHIVLVLIGEGVAYVADEIMDGGVALQQASIEPIILEAKEGLALINGTHLMCALGTLLVEDAEQLLSAAITASAMMIDANRATDAFLDPRVHEIRQQHGQQWVAANMRDLLSGSTILPSHRTDDPRVQDPYSFRCTPQVLGAVKDTLDHVRTVVERELGAVTDNPLVFPNNGDIISAGNFHGMPLAIALDMLTIALTHIAGISERRIYHLLSASDSENPLNAYLSPQPGLHSGLMIAQYTAAAACNELQTLSAPASVHNVPTSAGMEDYNSFGPTAGHQAWQALDLARHVIAIEFLCASEALEYQRPLQSGTKVETAYATIRQQVVRLTEDRSPTPDIGQIVDLIQQDKLGSLPTTCW